MRSQALQQMVEQRVVDAEAAARFHVNLARLRSASSKALDNIPTCRRTGWMPQYPNYRVGVEAALAATGKP